MARGDGSVEVQFARKLAGNDRTGRDRALRKLRKWLESRSASSTEPVMSEVELLRLWKGLFYCMWMSDKPLVQEQLAEQLTQLTGCMTSLEDALAFAGAGFATMRREWNAIDSVRRDKFMMLVRRLLRQSLLVVAERRWSSAAVSSLLDMYRREFIRPEHKQLPVGLQLHLLDIYLEELAKVSRGDILPSMCLQMLQPFVELLKTTADSRLLNGIVRSVFRQLMKQSDPGLAYEKASEVNSDDDEAMLNGDADSSDDNATQDHGSQTGDAIQDPGPMDPRAGGVDVILPQLRVDYGELAQRLITAGGDPTVRQHNRNVLYKLAQQCRQVEAGEYPMAVRVPDGAQDCDSDISEDEIEAAVQRLQEHKAQLNADSRKIRKRMRKTASDDDGVAATSLKKRKLQKEASESVVAEEEEEKNRSFLEVKKKKVRDLSARGDVVELNVVNGGKMGSSSPFVESAEQIGSFLSPVRKKNSRKPLQSQEVLSEEPAVSPVRKKKNRKPPQSEEVSSEEPAVSPVRKKKNRKSPQSEEVSSEEPAVSPVRKKKNRKSPQSEEVPSEEPAVSPVGKKKGRKSLQSEEASSEEPAVSSVRKKKSKKSLQSEEASSEELAEESVSASGVVKRRKELQNDVSMNGECESSEVESVMNGMAKKKRKERLLSVSAVGGDSSETVSRGMNGHVEQENGAFSMIADSSVIVASAGSDTSAVLSKKKRRRQSADPLLNGPPAHSPIVNGAGHSEQCNSSPSSRGKSTNVGGGTANGGSSHSVDEIGVDALSGEAEVASPKSAKKAKKLLKKRARSGETGVGGSEPDDSSAAVLSAQTTLSPTLRPSSDPESVAASATSVGSHTSIGRVKRKSAAAEGAGSVESTVVEAVVGRASAAGDWCLEGQDDWGDAMEAEEAPVVGDVSRCRPAMRRPDPLPTLTAGSLTKKMKKRSKSNPGTPRTPATPGSKKVNINLSRNTAQAFKEHLMTVRNSPQTPHNPDKLPVKGLLKPFTPNPSSSGKKKRFTAADFF